MTKLSLKQLKSFTVAICILGDWIAAIYVYNLIKSSRESFEKMLAVVGQAQGVNTQEVDISIIDSFFNKAVNVTIGTLVLLLALHLIFYFFYYRQKAFALFYVKTLSYLGVVFYGLFALTTLSNPLFALLLFLQTALYLFVIIQHKKNPLTSEGRSNV